MSGFGQKMQGDWKKFQDALKTAENVDYNKMHKQMGEAFVSNIHLRFVDQVDPQGEPWKKGYKKSGQTLTRNATLSSSFTYKASAKHVEVGSNVIYAAIHHFGGKIRAKKKNFLKFNIDGRWAQKKYVVMPKREIVGFSKPDEQDIATIFNRFITGGRK